MKMSLAKKLGIPLLALALLSACSKDDDKEETTVTYRGYKLVLENETNLSPEQLDILAKVNAEQPIEFAAISEAMIVEHAKSYVSRNAEVKLKNTEMPEGAVVVDAPKSEELKQASVATATIIRDRLRFNIAAGLSLDADLNDIKMVAEDILVAQHHAPIIYNVESNSPLDLITQNKMQCYSGTVYAQMVFRSGRRAQFVKNNPVVIYKFGHILPGYMVDTPNGYELVEVETTVSGRGERRTLVNELYEEQRIIDAEVFALIEIFKSRITNGDEILKTALIQTAQKYNIPLDQIEPRSVLTNGARVADKNNVFLNSDFMMFGNINNVPKGDTKRAESSRTAMPSDLPNEVYYVDSAPREEEQNFVEEKRGPQKDREGSSTPIAIFYEKENIVRVIRSEQSEALWRDLTSAQDSSFSQYLVGSRETDAIAIPMVAAGYMGVEFVQPYFDCNKDKTTTYQAMNGTYYMTVVCADGFSFNGFLHKANTVNGFKVRYGKVSYRSEDMINQSKPEEMRAIMVTKTKKVPEVSSNSRPAVEMGVIDDVQGPTFAPVYDQPMYKTN